MTKNASLCRLTKDHLDKIETHYDASAALKWPGKHYREILAHYYCQIVPSWSSVLEVGCGCGEMILHFPNEKVTGVDISAKQIERARACVPRGCFLKQSGEELCLLEEKFDAILLADTLNYAGDVQQLLESLQKVSGEETRLVLNIQSSLWRPVLALAERLGFKTPTPAYNWLDAQDVGNLLELAGWEVVSVQPRVLCPIKALGVGWLLNKWLAPLLPWACLTVFMVARPKKKTDPDMKRTVSVVIPARNEAGNIESAVLRTPEMGAGTELIFIEGHSKDATWEEIQKMPAKYPERNIKIMRQTGKGKGNAVREGFAAASGDILMILDADLTMPPEELPKYYDAITRGYADFANGVRLIYPMESQAMRFLNLCANKTFGILFSWLINQSVKDTLCGTKVLSRINYEKIAANRSFFGDFDPFGDFDLILGAAKLNLKIVDIPIRYRDRTYGETNIQRWRHGLLLLRMVLFAAKKLKFI